MPVTRINSMSNMAEKIPGCAVTAIANNTADAATTSQNQPPSMQDRPTTMYGPSSPSTPCSRNDTNIKTTIPKIELVNISGDNSENYKLADGDSIMSILDISDLNSNTINTTTNNTNQINSISQPAHVYAGTSRQSQIQVRSSQTSNNLTSRQRPRLNLSNHLEQSLRTMYSTVSIDVPPSYHDIPGTVPSYHGRTSGPPPSYDDVINPNAPPPTYQSLFGQVMEARKTSNGLLDLLRRLLIILISTLGCTIIIGFLIFIPFSMIIVGAIYLDDCHIENIPAFLLIGGSVWAIKNTISCYTQCKREPDYDFDPENQPRSSRYSSLLNCFLFGWFIAGCVIVYRNYEPNYDEPTSLRYCNKILYSYAFWLVTSTIVIFSLFVSCICCLMISSVIASRQDGDDPS